MKTYNRIHRLTIRPKCSRRELLSDQARLARWLAVNTQHSNSVHVAKSLERINRELQMAASDEAVEVLPEFPAGLRGAA